VSCSVCNRTESPLKNDICQRNNTLQHTRQQNGTTHCNTHCNKTEQHTATHTATKRNNTLQHTLQQNGTTHCNTHCNKTEQHTVTHTATKRNNTLQHTLQQNGSNGTRRLCLFKFVCQHTSTFTLCLSPPISPLHRPIQIPSRSASHIQFRSLAWTRTFSSPIPLHPPNHIPSFNHTHTQILLSYFHWDSQHILQA